MKADLIFVTNRTGLLSKIISYLTGKTKPAKAVHVAGITDRNSVIEALATVKETPLLKWKNHHEKYEIWRNENWTDDVRQQICDEMSEFKGEPYGFHKLILIALDLIIAKIWKEKFIFRRLLFNEDWPICTWVYAYAAHNVNDYKFGVEPEYTDPHTMRMHCKNSQEWKLVERMD